MDEGVGMDQFDRDGWHFQAVVRGGKRSSGHVYQCRPDSFATIQYGVAHCLMERYRCKACVRQVRINGCLHPVPCVLQYRADAGFLSVIRHLRTAPVVRPRGIQSGCGLSAPRPPALSGIDR